MKSNRFHYLLFISLMLCTESILAQKISIDNQSIVESQNYSFNPATNTHTILTKRENIKNGIDIYNGYLLLDLGVYNDQSQVSIKYNYIGEQDDFARVCLKYLDANQRVKYSKDFYLSSEVNELLVPMEKALLGSQIWLEFYSSKGFPYIKQGILELTELGFDTTNLVDEIQTGEKPSVISILMFPNPSSGIFSVKSSEKITSIQISDIYGKSLVSGISDHIIIRNDNSTIDLSDQPNGVYFIHIQGDKGRVVKKIVKQSLR